MTERSVTQNELTDVISIRFKESPSHSALDWHDAPQRQYVITLSGTLEFTTRDGETFVLRPGDVLVAEDCIGSGHKWPYRHPAVAKSPRRLKPGTPSGFVAKE